jgi:hypothetical protein
MVDVRCARGKERKYALLGTPAALTTKILPASGACRSRAVWLT